MTLDDVREYYNLRHAADHLREALELIDEESTIAQGSWLHLDQEELKKIVDEAAQAQWHTDTIDQLFNLAKSRVIFELE
jgi:hypothetical protein